jgi:excisionase family DNA binding protein
VEAYTVEQVAEMLHVGRDKVYYLLRTGQLRSIKIGKLRRITSPRLVALSSHDSTPWTYGAFARRSGGPVPNAPRRGNTHHQRHSRHSGRRTHPVNARRARATSTHPGSAAIPMGGSAIGPATT